jgi:hypothetical protein
MRYSTLALIGIYLVAFFAIVELIPDYFWIGIPLGLIIVIIWRVVIPLFERRAEEIIREEKIAQAEIEEERREWNNKSIILAIVGIVGIALAVFVQIPWFNTISYMLSLFALSFALTKDGDAFNFTLFLGGMLVYLLIPSVFGQSLSMMSFDQVPPVFNLDANQPTFELPNIGAIFDAGTDMVGSSSVHEFALAFQNFVHTLRTFVLIALPIIIGGLIAWAFYAHPDKVPDLIVKTVIAVGIIAFFSVLFPGKILGFEGLDMWGSGGVVNTFVNQIYSLLPLLLSVVTLVIAWWSRHDSFAKLMVDREDRTKKKWNVRMDRFHWGMFGLLMVIAIWALARYLMSTEAIGFGNAGVLGLFIVITVIASLPILLGKLPVHEGTLGGNVAGILMGMAALFFAQQAITAVAYNADMLAFSLDVNSIWGQTFLSIGDTMLFTATTESLVFHVTIPALALIFLYRRVRTRDQRAVDRELQKGIREREVDIRRQETLIKVLQDAKGQITTEIRDIAPYVPKVQADVKALEKVRGLTKRVAYLRTEINDTTEEIEQIQDYLGRYSEVTWGRMVFSRWIYGAYFLVFGIFLPNIGFAFFHWFRSGGYDAFGTLQPPAPIWLWMTEGPFLVFVVSGMVLVLVGLKYGWMSALLTHGLWNAMIITMSSVAAGGLG